MPKVSIIIRSYNDIDCIDHTMNMIVKQSFNDFEMINVDCSSTDGTLDIIKKYNTKGKIFTISPTDYVPGRVLNKMVKECSGKIIVFNNSDCIPINNIWLQKLVDCFSDKTTMACFGNQLPRKDARPLVIKDNTRAFGDGSISSNWFHFFSLATSAARTDTLKKYPFNENIQYSEDIEWSYRIKQLGCRIQYAPESKVEHSHNYTLKEVKKRFYSEGYADGMIYKTPTSFFKDFSKPLIMEVLRDLTYLFNKGYIHYIPYGLTYRFQQRFNSYKGRKDYFKGKILWPHLQNNQN
ncbi:MAG: glycosyltransferase [bacterium]|nr:glycosyltransferase [bacterium]